MSFTYLNNIPLEQALKTYLEELKKLNIPPATETISVQNSLGRITAKAVYAVISSPHYNASAMDGIALRASSTFGATDTTPVILQEGVDFERVDTGDPLPDRFDCVVMIEDVIEAGNGKIRLISAAAPWQHVRQIGEDICQGEIVLSSNTRITPSAIGAMLAGGVTKVEVRKRLRIGLIPTGDEIISPTDHPAPGEIIEFNTSIFSAMIEEWGGIPKVYGIVPDVFEAIKAVIAAAAEECDLVIVNAGSSAGRGDFTSGAIDAIGKVFVHGIAIKPGKPTILGQVKEKPVIGVPGYPVSGIVVMEKLVKTVYNYLMHTQAFQGPTVETVLSRRIVSTLKYREFVRVKLGQVGEKLVATPLSRGAGVVTSFMKADGLLEVPMDFEGIEAGERVKIELLRNEQEIRNTLVITGSHDPLIDIAADITRRMYSDGYIASAHVGSMGGIMAVKRSEAHIAGIHLLDETSGEYNTTYIQRYFPEEKIAVIKGVRRVQGLMIAPGNPKGIKEIASITAEGIRYVNRQKGAGTRILLDYLLKKNDLQPFSIYGYEREEFTHMAVAALVAAGSADTGMGIYSAARAYHLDFIPVCEEQYDFIVPEAFLQLQVVQRFIEVLRSDAFSTELKGMGGYVADGCGEVQTGGAW